MKEESNCFGLIIWIRAARGYTHLSRAPTGRNDGDGGGGMMRKRAEEVVSGKDSLAFISLKVKRGLSHQRHPRG